jgi:large subunit ribosomal protein L17
MAVIELVEALTVAQQAVGEAERARGTRFATRKAAGAGAAAAAGEVTADALEAADVPADDDTTGPGGDTSPAVTGGESAADVEAAEEVVADVFEPNDEVQDDADVTPEPQAENAAVVDDPELSPEVARAAAAEVEAAELGDAATAGSHAPGGDAAPDPK